MSAAFPIPHEFYILGNVNDLSAFPSGGTSLYKKVEEKGV